MDRIKPIETIYNNNRFRSRLEARWAVFFDVMGIEYQYEPEGYRLDYGIDYLPDFALTNVRFRGQGYNYLRNEPLYVEVKGVDRYEDIRLDDRVRVEMFAKEYPIIVLGNIPYDSMTAVSTDPKLSSFYFLFGDEYNGFFSRYNDEIWFCGADHKQWTGNADTALSIARQARFEHGENPKFNVHF